MKANGLHRKKPRDARAAWKAHMGPRHHWPDNRFKREHNAISRWHIAVRNAR